MTTFRLGCFISLCTLLLIISQPVIAAPSPSPDASDSANIDSEVIKENIKKRIQEVIQNQIGDTQKKIAISGTISTITTTSFSVETDSGIKQASMSAQATTVVELPGNKEVKLEDVGIGDYVAALGFLPDTNKVLETKRLLVLRTPPIQPEVSPFYGTIVSIDTKKKIVEINNPKLNEQKSFSISTKTDLIIKDAWNHQDELTLSDLTENRKVLVLYTPAASENLPGKAFSLTVRSDTELTPEILSPTPTP